MTKVDEKTNKWIMNNKPNQFSRFNIDINAKYDHINNNMFETFNSWLGENIELPILSMLEIYRRRIIKRLQKRLKATHE